MEQSKKPWLSKTLWINAIAGILALAYPPAAEWIAAHPDIVLAGFAALNMLLRLVTKEKVGLID